MTRNMSLLRNCLILLSVLSIFSTFPTAAQCDSSYYDKYYSARKFFPLKRNRDLILKFTLIVDPADKLANYEQVALVGDHEKLGAWNPNKAIMLNSTDQHNQWSGLVALPQNTTIKYRYFIAAVHKETQGIQVRHWESSVVARSLRLTTIADNRTDYFGLINPHEREVQKGWLNSGKLVQFKLFGNPLNLKEVLPAGQQMRLKLQPIEPERLNTILPSATASTEYVHMAYGNSFLREQPHQGVPYAENDILIFQTTVAQMDRVAYLLKIFSCQLNSDLVRLVGYQYIFADSLKGTEGNFTVQLISPTWFNSIGTITLQYLVISPLESWENANASVSFQTTFVEYWRDTWMGLDVGHRGLGRSLKQALNAVAPMTENTVGSLKASGELGADMVEFDVMLTSDYVPIVYHEYEVYVCLDSKTPRIKSDLTEVLIKDITYEQLKSLKTYQVIQGKVVEYAAHNNVLVEDNRLFPLFSEVLDKLNKSLGLDIEIKWPQLMQQGGVESVQSIDKNLYVDRILEVMYEHGCGRLSFFSSFDADICTLLRYKQNMYPIMLLIDNQEDFYTDPRTNSIYDAVNTAQAFDLAGIIPGASFISKNPDWVQVVARQNKKIFVWGDELKDAASIAWFKQQAVHGVIYDRLDLWLPPNKTSLVEADGDLLEFLQLQCPANNEEAGSGEGNLTVYNILSNVLM